METLTRVDTPITCTVDIHVLTLKMDTEEVHMAVNTTDSITMVTMKKPTRQAILHAAILVSPLATTIRIYASMNFRIHTQVVITTITEDVIRQREAQDRVVRNLTHELETTNYTGTDIRCANLKE